MKSLRFEDYAAFIGLDWADSKHDICLQEAGKQRREFNVIEHTPEAIQRWALGLLKRFGDRPVALSCELKKGSLINALAKYPHIVIFPLNPAAVAQYRKAFASSGAKDDPSDAQLQCDLLQRHFDRFTPVLERGGKKSWVHWRYAAPRFLRQTFVEWAGESVRYSFWANAYYQ